MPRRVILVLGMHRSGTSALASALGCLGAGLPRDPMPASADNPSGYQESRAIARFHNRLLESAGTRWNDDAPVPREWFDDPARRADEAEAAALLATEFGDEDVLVLKCPRLCRLLPLWIRVLEREAIEPFAILALRDPREVARSLRARLDDAAFRPAAIAAEPRAMLLWLRHLLDAERATRRMPRVAIAYPALVADWRAAFEPLFLAGVLPRPTFEGATAADRLLTPDLRRQRPTDDAATPFPGTLAATVVGAVASEGASARRELDALATALDRLSAAAAGRRGRDAAAASDPWGASILGTLEGLSRAGHATVTAGERPPRILFLSSAPTGAGHVYRVEHARVALGESGWQTAALPLGDDRTDAELARADLVACFRVRWDDPFAAVHAAARARGLPLVYDVDDLLFEAAVFEAGHVALLDRLPEERRREWIAAAAAHRRALAACDACVVTTPALAAAAAAVTPRVHVVPNGVDARMIAAADAARASPRPSSVDGLLRLGFAAGTPTHHRDFATIVPALADLLARRADVRLVVAGHLDLGAVAALSPHADRIEIRAPVPLPDLHAELARFDVNLAPLETGNPFCEAKSPIRCTAAALVACPSVVAATGPLVESVVEGETGLVARGSTEWTAAIEALLDDPARRLAMGEAARADVVARYGPAIQRERFARAYGTILAAGPRAVARG